MACPLTGEADSVSQARECTQGFFAAAAPEVSAESLADVMIAVSELVSNAVLHAPGPCVLELALEGGRVRIGVSDGTHTVPSPRTAQFNGSGGFGLHMLRVIAGPVEVIQHSRGKTVFVRMAL